ncbi:thiamine biosynthesis protein ThiC [Kitasatospora sp. NPDC094011]
MKISKSITELYGDKAVNTEYDAEALAGMQAKSEEFAEHGNRVYLPLAD